MKFLIYIAFVVSILHCDEMANVIKQQNVLYIKNMIETEEKIAQAIEKYLLTEFKIPVFEYLSVDDYLGENFSLKNRMGEDIGFKNALNLTLKYAIKYDVKELDKYLFDLYNRDLYRNKTVVTYKKDDYTKSYISIVLSKEARTIHNILKAGNTISKSCSASLKSQYCNNSINTIRWYNANGYWIEYNKADFEDANVTVQNESLLYDTKLNNLPVGTYIRVQNSSRYIKALSNQILKVE
ncbi:MAG: hypothetical protein WHU93_09055 [Arcobacteraceae bacterium]